MGMTVQRRKDTGVARVFMHKIADIRGGVSVKVSELGSDYLLEGTVLSKPNNGICSVVKVAKLHAGALATDVALKVKKGHQFKVNDFVLSALSSKAVKITAIDKSAKEYDTLTISGALGALAEGAFIAEAKEASTEASQLLYSPFALTGTGRVIDQNSNLDVDAWVIGVTKGNDLPSFIASELKGIINY